MKKNMYKYLFVVVLFLVVSFLAKQKNIVAETIVEEKAEVQETVDAEQKKIILVVNEDDCKRIMQEVNTQEKTVAPAEYVDGVDVYGKKVVPAVTSVKESLFSGQDIISLSFKPDAWSEIEKKGVEIDSFNIGHISLKDGVFMLGNETLDEKSKEMVIDACTEVLSKQ